MMKLIIIVIGYIDLNYAFAFLSQCTSHAFHFNILKLGRETQLYEGCSFLPTPAKAFSNIPGIMPDIESIQCSIGFHWEVSSFTLISKSSTLLASMFMSILLFPIFLLLLMLDNKGATPETESIRGQNYPNKI